MRHGYLRPSDEAVQNAENALRSRGTDDIARLVEERGRTFENVMNEAGVEINFDSVTTLGGTGDEKRDKLSTVIAERTAGMNIMAERQEREQAEAENAEANERLQEYRRGPRLFTPEQVRQLATSASPNPAPHSTALAEQVQNYFGDGNDFASRFGSPFAFETSVPLMGIVNEPVNVIAAGSTVQTGDGGTGSQANTGFLRFPPLQPDLEYAARRMPSVFSFLSGRVARNLPANYGGAYRYSAETAPTENAPAFRAQATALPRRKYGTEIRTENLQICGTWVPVAREEFMDVPGFTMFLNNILRDDVLLSVDTSLISGDGTGANLTGLNNISGVNTVDISAIVASAALNSGDSYYGVTGVHQAITTNFATGHAMSDFIVMNPNDWHEVRTQRDTQERFLVGDALVEVRPSLFGLPVINTPGQTENSVFVGSSSKLMLLTQGGIMVEWTNSHDDGFQQVDRRSARLDSSGPGVPTGFRAHPDHRLRCEDDQGLIHAGWHPADIPHMAARRGNSPGLSSGKLRSS